MGRIFIRSLIGIVLHNTHILLDIWNRNLNVKFSISVINVLVSFPKLPYFFLSHLEAYSHTQIFVEGRAKKELSPYSYKQSSWKVSWVTLFS